MPYTRAIDFRLLKHFGLSLNTKKHYCVQYDPHTWKIVGVYDDLKTALKEGYNTSLEEYKDSNGNANVYYKGFIQNLSVWELLGHLCGNIQEDAYMNRFTRTKEKFAFILPPASDYTLSRIHHDIHAFPGHIEGHVCKFGYPFES